MARLQLGIGYRDHYDSLAEKSALVFVLFPGTIKSAAFTFKAIKQMRCSKEFLLLDCLVCQAPLWLGKKMATRNRDVSVVAAQLENALPHEIYLVPTLLPFRYQDRTCLFTQTFH